MSTAERTTPPRLYVDYVSDHGELQDGWYVLEDVPAEGVYGRAWEGPFRTEGGAAALQRSMLRRREGWTA